MQKLGIFLLQALIKTSMIFFKFNVQLTDITPFMFKIYFLSLKVFDFCNKFIQTQIIVDYRQS
jgi:hypothetical protein